MKLLKLFSSTTAAIALVGITLTGCKKDDREMPTATTGNESSLSVMYDNSVAEAAYDDAGNVAEEGVNGSLDNYKLNSNERVLTSCATITLDLLSNPHKAIIDFGDTDCLGRDGSYRRGKIIVTWTGSYLTEGSVFAVTFDNYYLNFNNIRGLKTITNNGRNDRGNLTFSITVNGTVGVDPQYSPGGTSGIMSYRATKIKEWVAGEATLLRNDDVYLVHGNASGTGTNGITYTAATDASNPLKREIGFPHFTNGITAISRVAAATDPGLTQMISVDYGYIRGQRDDLARVTVNGNTYTIILGMRSH